MELKINIEENKIYSPLKGKWKILKPEEEVKQRFIAQLVNEYGYALNQMDEELQVSRAGRGHGRARADIVIWKNEADRRAKKNAFIVVECKAENITIREEDYQQGANYASWAHAEFFAITNLQETRCFKVRGDKIPGNMDPVSDIPKAAEMDDPLLMEKLRGPVRSYTHDEFQRRLFKCHNIIRNNDKLSPEAAFDEISKILFIKMQYEKKHGKHSVFTLEHFKKRESEYNGTGTSFMNRLFDETKAGFDDYRIFEENETIRIKQAGFERIIGELEQYNLVYSEDDVKGIVFEEFLGKTFRGELGQFFTPRTVVDFMVKILDPGEGERVCDPCCGSGGFLIRVFRHVKEKVEIGLRNAWRNAEKYCKNDDIAPMTTGGQPEESLCRHFENLTPHAQRDKLNCRERHFSELDTSPGGNGHFSRLNEVCAEPLFGVDANPRMARVAKMNMIMNGDGHCGVYHHDGLLDVEGVFENRFDIVLTNPPFGARVSRDLTLNTADIPSDQNEFNRLTQRYGAKYRDALERLKDHVGKPIPDLFDLGKKSTLTEVLFLERCLRLLKPGGRMGIVLPEGVLNADNLQKVRDYVEDRARLLLVVSLPREVFRSSGASIKSSIVFLRKFTEDEARRYNEALRAVTGEVNTKYEAERKKADKKRLKELNAVIGKEIRREIKTRCNYEFLMADVRKAGISSTGAPDENQLPTVAREFEVYRKKNKLWDEKSIQRMYVHSENNIFGYVVR